MLVNGKPADTVPAADRGFQYGDGVFETIKLAGGKPEFWARHMARLEDGCKRLGIPGPGAAQIKRDADQLCAGAENGVLKIMVTRGTGGRGYRPPVPANPTRVAALYPAPDYPETYYSEGVRVRMCTTLISEQPRLAGIKHMNRLEQILARSEWSDGETAEGLMLDARGHAVEGTMTNLFAVKDGALMTPDLSRCGVAGIMRAVVLDLARAAGMQTRVRDIPAGELQDAEEIFLTNSVIGIWPVKDLAARAYQPGAVTRKLGAALTAAPKD